MVPERNLERLPQLRNLPELVPVRILERLQRLRSLAIEMVPHMIETVLRMIEQVLRMIEQVLHMIELELHTMELGLRTIERLDDAAAVVDSCSLLELQAVRLLTQPQ